MPIYDVKCTECGLIAEDVWLKMDEDPNICPECGTKMCKLCGGHFKLVYNNQRDICGWADSGYASSMYWKAVKDARGRGEKVKGATEN
jgi:putative FmdB family regulatory protein